jgi:hypothetical protein
MAKGRRPAPLTRGVRHRIGVPGRVRHGKRVAEPGLAPEQRPRAIQDNALRHSSGWANYFLDCVHTAESLIPMPEERAS